MKSIISIIFSFLLFFTAFAQESSPYETSLKVDGPVILGSLGLGYVGLPIK